MITLKIYILLLTPIPLIFFYQNYNEQNIKSYHDKIKKININKDKYKRAIVTFLPNKKYITQFTHFLYNSWLYTQTNSCIKTDIIIFTPSKNYLPNKCSEIIIFKNGTYIYTNKKYKTHNCYYILKTPVNQSEWNNYRFTDSIIFLTNRNILNFLKSYDILLKTESDTFLTKKFCNFKSNPNKIVVGNGAYSYLKVVKDKIKQVANSYYPYFYKKLNHTWIHNVGATIYTSPLLMYQSHKIAEQILKSLIKKEFPVYGKWPYWYKGVASMYAIEIGVNMIGDEYNIIKDRRNFDHNSIRGMTNETMHIHCFHSSKLFSKFVFGRNGYKDYENKELDIDKICEYCLFIALGRFNEK